MKFRVKDARDIDSLRGEMTKGGDSVPEFEPDQLTLILEVVSDLRRWRDEAKRTQRDVSNPNGVAKSVDDSYKTSMERL